MEKIDFLFDKSVIFAIANTIYCISYVLTNMVWLRVLAVVAAASTLPYFFFQPEPLYQALFWQSMFLTINLVNLIILLMAMRPPKLSELDVKLHSTVFSDLKPHELVPLFKAARQEQRSAQQKILSSGNRNERLYLILEGESAVISDGVEVARLGANRFIGEMSFLTDSIVSADVVTKTDSVFYVWDKDSLDRLFRKQSLYRSYFYQLCGMDMVNKIKRMNQAGQTV